MKVNPRKNVEQMNTLVQVWTALNPGKALSGITLKDVRSGFQRSFDARARVAAARAELSAAFKAREMADDESLKLYKRAVGAIAIDPHEGTDGEMYKALTEGTRSARRHGAAEANPAPVTTPVP